jgi:hypothetical protein
VVPILKVTAVMPTRHELLLVVLARHQIHNTVFPSSGHNFRPVILTNLSNAIGGGFEQLPGKSMSMHNFQMQLKNVVVL